MLRLLVLNWRLWVRLRLIVLLWSWGILLYRGRLVMLLLLARLWIRLVLFGWPISRRWLWLRQSSSIYWWTPHNIRCLLRSRVHGQLVHGHDQSLSSND